MFCERCGCEMDESMRFCTACGAPMPARGIDHVVGQPASSSSDSSFEQGSPVQCNVPESDFAKPAKSGKSGGKGLIVAIVSIAVIVLAALFLNRPSAEGEKTITPSEAASQENIRLGGEKSTESAVDSLQPIMSEEQDESILAPDPVLTFSGFSDVVASSTLPTGGINTASYSASNLMDGLLSTCWCEGSGGSGQGEYVVFSGPSMQEISGFDIWAGYQNTSSEKGESYLYLANARPREFEVYADDVFVERVSLNDSGLSSQRVVFSRPCQALRVKLVIDSVYPGSKYDDCCISEISFF